MNIRLIVSNLSVAFLAQGISLLLSVILSIFVPKFLGVTEFGYWQLFLFYTSFCGVFHFGLNDGVYLVNGGKSYGSLDCSNIGTQFWYGMMGQSFLSLLFCVFVFVAPMGGERNFILFCTAIYMPINNAAYYLGFVFQASNRVKWFSCSIILDKVMFIAIVMLFMFVGVASFHPLVIGYIFSRFIALTFCLIKGKTVVSAKRMPAVVGLKLVYNSIRVGISLTLANVASLLVVGIMRFCIDSYWGIETFGQLSLALSLENFFLVFIQQVSMVLFPVLRQIDSSERRIFYRLLSNVVSFLVPISYVLYFPIVMLLEVWLPAYSDAFVYFAFILPLCLFDSRMNMISITFFKVLRMEKKLLLINATTVLASGVLSYICTYVLENIYLTLIGVVVCVAARSAVAEYVISRALHVPFERSPILINILFSIVFIVSYVKCDMLVAFAICGISYCLILFFSRGKISSSAMLLESLK